MTPPAALVALDARLLFNRGLFRTVAASSVLAGMVAACASGGAPGGGWWRLAQAVRVIVPLLLSFGAILGAVSVAGDAAAGSLRGVLTRPVSRASVVLSRALVLAAGVIGVYSLSVLVALLAASLLGPFDAIRFGDEPDAPELITRAELLTASVRLILIVAPALVAASLVGLMVSCCFNDPASATIGALLLVLSPYVVEAVFRGGTPWSFTHGATLGAAVFSDLAEGVTTRLGLATDTKVLLAAAWRPLAWGGVAVALGCAVFSRRDFKA